MVLAMLDISSTQTWKCCKRLSNVIHTVLVQQSFREKLFMQFPMDAPKKKRKKMTHGRGLSKNHSYQIIALEYYSGFSEE